MIVKLGTKCLLGLHKMWISHCIIIHQTITDNIIIEEMNDIRDEIEMIYYSNQYLGLVNSKKIRPIRLIELLSVSNIKGWLFNYYSITTDYQSYNCLNKRSIEYQNRIRRDALTTDITFRNWI